ncbi:hypothetical protein SAMN05216389_11443 [Oceanobacillus limi]|uniref:Uncharacterized protein n=2 Tax=Oceanobacillus limi TaxID=930131 RepID=A0A1I0F7W5_9BACI|nr:hypothetical protein SAMN05216389_11443 [Oceanobacillus limi]
MEGGIRMATNDNKGKEKNNMFKENKNHGEHRNGRKSQFKNNAVHGGDEPNEYVSRKDL